ncbi:MAG: radical SAM protein [Myxococcales bacterium]|nr:radical SAM protein [Myxococcales bacterium]
MDFATPAAAVLALVPAAPRWTRRRKLAVLPVTASSIALFRLGEQCNNKCPMCSNSGRPEAWFQKTDDLLRRADYLHQRGLRRVVLTGGEPTIHPGFWDVVARVNAHGMRWDINTNGRSFADPVFAERAAAAGLLRAIVSLHSHEPAASMVISGVNARGHDEIIAGIAELARAGVPLLLNCVLARQNLAHLEAYVAFCRRLAPDAVLKFCFPTTTGKGGGWEGIHLQYAEVQPVVRAIGARCAELGVGVTFEALPACVVGDASARNLSRSGFGETHYLDDVSGDRLYSIGHIEAELSCYPPACADCRARASCPGIGVDYATRLAAGELVPFP